MKDWKAWLGVGISAFLLWWVFRGEDLGDIAAQVAAADRGWIIATGAIATAGGMIRAIRWRLLLAPVGPPVSLMARWKALNIGFAVTNMALGRLGEVARPYALSRMTPISTSAGLGTIVLERVLDMVALLLLLVVVLFSPGFPSDAMIAGRPIGYAAAAAGVIGALALAVVIALAARPERLVRIARSLETRFPALQRGRVGDGAEAFVQGLDLLKDPMALFKAFAWSVVLWLWMAASFWAAFRAFGMDLGFTAAMFTQCSVAVLVAVPAAPGFLGTLQTGVLISVAGVFGFADADALSMAVGYHMAGYIPVTSLGLYYAWRLRIRVASLREDAAGAA